MGAGGGFVGPEDPVDPLLGFELEVVVVEACRVDVVEVVDRKSVV